MLQERLIDICDLIVGPQQVSMARQQGSCMLSTFLRALLAEMYCSKVLISGTAYSFLWLGFVVDHNHLVDSTAATLCWCCSI
jgi:hypothetical protein